MARKVSGILSTLDALRVPISTLKPYGNNPRRGALPAIKASLEAHGQYRPVVVRKGTHEVLAGNHMVRAARDLGWNEVAATFVDVDDDEAARIVLVDNRTNDLAGYDDVALRDLLASLPTLEGTGFDQAAVDALLEGLRAPTKALTDADAVPEPPPVPTTASGDVWLLGDHRLLCGDATLDRDVHRLMGSARACLLWTDPPYGVSYVGKTKAALTIENDGASGLAALLLSAFQQATTALEPGSPFYVAHPAGAQCVTFGNAVLAAGWQFHQTLIWVKDSMVLGHADYHFRHEPMIYGWVPGPGRSGRGNHSGSRWYGDHAQTSVFEVARPNRSESHPTMKPVELVAQCLRNSSPPGGAVLDLFGGSGSTLVAAQQEGRRAYLMEIAPAYCDVICRRFQEFSGIRPILEATGKEHDFSGGA